MITFFNSAFHLFGVDKLVVSWNRTCATVWRHLVKATEVTTGLAESNGSLPPGGWLKVTCGLNACTQGVVLGPTLSNEYGRTLPFLPPLVGFVADLSYKLL